MEQNIYNNIKSLLKDNDFVTIINKENNITVGHYFVNKDNNHIFAYYNLYTTRDITENGSMYFDDADVSELCYITHKTKEEFYQYIKEELKKYVEEKLKTPTSNASIIYKKTLEDIGKIIKFSKEDVGILLFATSTDEDYYYAYLNKDDKLQLSSCVGKYNIVENVENYPKLVELSKDNNKIQSIIEKFEKENITDYIFTDLAQFKKTSKI